MNEYIVGEFSNSIEPIPRNSTKEQKDKYQVENNNYKKL
jgi:hypothetical protein